MYVNSYKFPLLHADILEVSFSGPIPSVPNSVRAILNFYKKNRCL